jgi:hypothetical protein
MRRLLAIRSLRSLLSVPGSRRSPLCFIISEPAIPIGR